METKDAIFGRRSVRKYTSQKISDTDLQEIVDAGLYAPSGINLQPWFFVAVRSLERMEELKGIMRGVIHNFHPVLEKRFAKNPEAITDTESFLESLGGAGTCILVFLLKPDYEDPATVLQGASAAIENMLLMAYDKGIGSCWMTAPVRAGFGEEIKNAFAPEHGQFVAAVTLGYPETVPKAPKRREGRFVII